jgi:hypothetical protein
LLHAAMWTCRVLYAEQAVAGHTQATRPTFRFWEQPAEPRGGLRNRILTHAAMRTHVVATRNPRRAGLTLGIVGTAGHSVSGPEAGTMSPPLLSLRRSTEAGVTPATHGVVGKTELAHSVAFVEVAAVENNRRLIHQVFNPLKVGRAELGPVGHDQQRARL